MSNLIIPKVSVTVVTYNHGEMLRECLESIVTQETDFSFEIIVGDDSSTDGVTQQILKDYATMYPHIIIPIFRSKNVGITENWLDVTRKARGEYIAHIDGDDRMLPGKIQKQAHYLDKHLDCTMVAHDIRIFDGKTGRVISEHFTRHNIPKVANINYLVLNGCYFGHSSKMYRRSSIISHYRDRPTIDFFMHIEQASTGNIGFINEVLGEYRKTLGSATDLNASFYQNIISGYCDAYERALELGVNPVVVSKGWLRFNYSIANQALLENNLSDFKKYIRLQKADYQFATWKHHLFNALKSVPIVVMFILKLNIVIYQCTRKIPRRNFKTGDV